MLQAMGIQRYLFFSIHNCERHNAVPLMRIKACTEEFLQQSGIPFTIFRLCGFMQVASSLRIPILGAHGAPCTNELCLAIWLPASWAFPCHAPVVLLPPEADCAAHI